MAPNRQKLIRNAERLVGRGKLNAAIDAYLESWPAGRNADEKKGDGAGDGEELGGRWGWLVLGKLGLDEAGVLAGVVLCKFGEELGEEEVIFAVGDELVGHVFNAVTRAEAPNDQPEVGAVLAEAAEILRGEGGEEELADGGYVVLLGVVAHGLAPVSGTE